MRPTRGRLAAGLLAAFVGLVAVAPAGATPDGWQLGTTPVPAPLPPGDANPQAASVAGTDDGSAVVYYAGNEAETWTYAPGNNSWTKRNPAQPPSVREGTAAGALAGGGPRTLLYGGFQSAGNTYFAETWMFDASTGQWTKRCSGCAPGGLARSMMAASPTDTLLFAGSKSFGFNNTLWRWDDASSDWIKVNPDTPDGFPPPRGDGQFAFDGTNFVLYGGVDLGFSSLADTWRLVALGGGSFRWEKVCDVCAPGPRSLAGFARLGGAGTPAGALLVGGSHLSPSLPATLHYSDGWFWDADDSSWTQVIPGVVPTPIPQDPAVPYGPTLGSFGSSGPRSVVLTDTRYPHPTNASVESNVIAWLVPEPPTTTTTTTAPTSTTSPTSTSTTLSSSTVAATAVVVTPQLTG